MQPPQWMSMADPIHGMIRLKRHHVHHQMVLDVMNSRPFQRLRRIKQMGMAEFVFPGATHSRFVHSIGATWLMIKTIEQLQEFEETRTLLQSPCPGTEVSLEQVLILAILVHDIGHTPLSHTLEDILDLKATDLLHDTYWNRLILNHDPELQAIWQRYGPQLPMALDRFLGLSDPDERHFLADLVSSQLDMDRLDYLQRDSHYLGVQYGRVEVERIITNLGIGRTPSGQPAVAVREEAIPAVEHYLFGRYEAYKMALHSLDKASETLLKKTLERFAWCRDEGLDPGHPADLLYRLMRDGRSLSVDEYLMLDDCYLWDKINLWARNAKDELLQQLANRLLGHDLFKYIELNPVGPFLEAHQLAPVLESLEQHYRKRGLAFAFGFDQMQLWPKPLYQPASLKPPIWVKRKNGTLSDFSDLSSLPLHSERDPGRRHLLFVWDKEAQRYLRQQLEKHRLLPA